MCKYVLYQILVKHACICLEYVKMFIPSGWSIHEYFEVRHLLHDNIYNTDCILGMKILKKKVLERLT